MILNLYNPPVTEQDFSIFSLSNADHHQNVITALQNRVALVTYELDPMPQEDLPSWLRRHQQAHNDINTFLGVNGVDLTDVDVKDKEQLESWILLHADEHFQWATQTGVF